MKKNNIIPFPQKPPKKIKGGVVDEDDKDIEETRDVKIIKVSKRMAELFEKD